MKILFDNLIKDATIASVNAAPNYPARNLQDGFLRRRYQVEGTSDSLSVQFDGNISINCIYMGFIGNISDIAVTMYSGGQALDLTFDSIHIAEENVIRIYDTDVIAMFAGGAADYFDDYSGLEFVSRHFNTITGVDEIRISYNGTDPFYVGGLSAGLCVDIPPAIVQWEDSYQDNSIVTASPYGQTLTQYIEPLKQFVFTFEFVDYNRFIELKEIFREAGQVPCWVTFFEDSESDYPPGYYVVQMQGQQRNRYTYTFTLIFTEAR